MLRKPLMLLSFDEIGSSIERGTLPSAAWCSTSSFCSHAWRHVSSERMSPSMKRILFHASTPTAFFTWLRLLRLPVEKLSSPVTAWPWLSRCSTRLEPMKPAAPVTSQRRGLRLMCCSTSSYLLIFTPCGCQFGKGGFVAVDHGAFGEQRLDRLARLRAHARAQRRFGQGREAVGEHACVADREKQALAPGPDHFGGAADVGMHHRQAERHGLERGKREGFDCGAAQGRRVARPEQRPHVLLQSGDDHAVADARGARARLDRAAHRPVAYQEGARRDAAP